jgi:type IV pilus assembly protein PilB
MSFNDEIRELIMDRASTGVLREAARRAGMITLRENGLSSIYDGVTTIDEVNRETLAVEQ